MLKINLITIGDIKEKYLREAIDEYSKRIRRFSNLNIVELKETIPASNSQKDIQIALDKDAKNIEKYLSGHLICLDIKGKLLSSEQLAEKIQKISINSSEISFIIGASNGISDSIKNICHERISFSPMTFPHQLMRVIFLEQLYRSFTILNNIAYHK